MKWNWDVDDLGCVGIYYGNELLWELDLGPEYTEREINLFVKEFIMKNQHLMREDL